MSRRAAGTDIAHARVWLGRSGCTPYGPPAGLLAFLTVMLSTVASAQTTKEARSTPGSPTTGVDWPAGVLQATGVGLSRPETRNPTLRREEACRAAKTLAYRALAEIVYSVQIDSRTTVSDHVLVSDTVKTRVTGLIRNAREVARRVRNDGSCEVTLVVPLAGDGSLSDSLFPNPPVVTETPTPPESPPSPTGRDPGDGVLATGVIFDASGLGARPSLHPRILDPEGRVVLSIDDVDQAVAQESMMVQWQVGTVPKRQRTGSSPRKVKCSALADPSGFDLTIAESDAALLRSNPELRQLLRACKVVITI